jgi:hypothetical protein
VLSNGITALTGRLIPGRRIPRPSNSEPGKPDRGVRDAIGRNKDITPSRADVIVDAGQCSGSAFGAVLDEFTTYQVEGSVVDYLASDG